MTIHFIFIFLFILFILFILFWGSCDQRSGEKIVIYFLFYFFFILCVSCHPSFIVLSCYPCGPCDILAAFVPPLRPLCHSAAFVPNPAAFVPPLRPLCHSCGLSVARILHGKNWCGPAAWCRLSWCLRPPCGHRAFLVLAPVPSCCCRCRCRCCCCCCYWCWCWCWCWCWW